MEKLFILLFGIVPLFDVYKLQIINTYLTILLQQASLKDRIGATSIYFYTILQQKNYDFTTIQKQTKLVQHIQVSKNICKIF